MKVQHKYSAGWYEQDEVCLAFWKAGEKWVDRIPFRWFFYLQKENAEKTRNILERKADDLRLTADGKFVKVFTDYYKRKELLEILEDVEAHPLEGDVSPLDRYMAEHNIEFDSESKVLFYDLETDGATGWDDITAHRVLCIAYRGPDMQSTEWLCAKTADDAGEKELLDRFLDVVSFHDILAAWNGDAYDEVVLCARSKKRGLRPGWKQVQFLDTMELFEKYYRRDAEGIGVRVSFALENIAQTVLGKGKIQDVPKHKLLEVWKADQEKLREYNVRDVDLMVEIEEKTEYLSIHRVLSNLCNRFLSSRSLTQAHLTDGFVLRYGAKNGIHFPTKYHEDTPKREKIKGAHVEESLKGLHEGVIDLDFSSLYPNIVMAFNISPETKLGMNLTENLGEGRKTCCAVNGAVFRTDIEGVFPAVSRIAVNARQEFKALAKKLEEEGKEGTDAHRKALQTSDVYKILSNAFYGALSSPYTRYYDPQCGAAITETGSFLIQRVFELSKSNALLLVAGDTDSGFFKCTILVAKEFIVIVAKDLGGWAEERGAKPGGFILKIDAEFERIFFTAKKKYAGKKTTGKIDIRGLEVIRSDGCKYAREMQRRFIEFILEAERPTATTAEKLVKSWTKKVFSGELGVDDLKISVGLQKSMNEYKTDGDVHVRVAKHLLATGREVYTGMKIPYMVVGKDEKGRIKAVHTDDYEGEYDAAQYWQSQIFPPTKRILDAVFPGDELIWKRLEKWNPNEQQKDLFEAKVENTEVVEFQLREGDRGKLQLVRDEMDKYPGKRQVALDIQLDDSEVRLMSEVRVSLDKELVKGIEKIVGHRSYFGPDQFDGV